MEQILTIAQSITTIAAAIVSVIAVIILVYVMVLCARFARLMKQITHTAESIQQLSQLPLHIVNSLLQRLLGGGE